MTVETIFSRFPVRGTGATGAIAATGTVCGLLCAAVLLGRKPYRAGVTVFLVCASYAGGAFIVFYLAKVLLPVIGPLLVCSLGATLAWWIRRQLPAFPQD